MTIPRLQRSRPHLASVLFIVGLVAAIVAGIPAVGGSSTPGLARYGNAR